VPQRQVVSGRRSLLSRLDSTVLTDERAVQLISEACTRFAAEVLSDTTYLLPRGYPAMACPRRIRARLAGKRRNVSAPPRRIARGSPTAVDSDQELVNLPVNVSGDMAQNADSSDNRNADQPS